MVRLRLEDTPTPVQHGATAAEKRFGNGDGVLDQGEADAIAKALPGDGKLRQSLGFVAGNVPKDGLELLRRLALPKVDDTKDTALRLIGGGANPYAAGTPASRAREANRLGIRVASEPTRLDLSQLAIGLCEASLARGETATAQAAVDSVFVALGSAPRGARELALQRLRAFVTQGLVLRPDQTSAVAALSAELYPVAPPYADWFKAGNKTLHAAFYFHEDYAEGFLASLRTLGLTAKKTDKGYDVTGTIDGMPVQGTARVVTSYGSDRTMFEKMDDPAIDLIFYGGHSNLGGNIGAALDAGPASMAGKKVVALWMCKGKQKLAAVSERYPDAEVITTKVPPPGDSGVPMLAALLKGIAARKTYDAIHASHTPADAFLYPNDPSVQGYRDTDGDGVIDGLDRWYSHKRGPSSTGAARDAVLFANTLLGYHLEDSDGTTPIVAGDVDKFDPAGWFNDPKGKAVSVTAQGGRFAVRFNERYKSLAAPSLGCLLVYALANHLQEQHGPVDQTGKLRSFLLAAELIAYTIGDGPAADDAMRELSAYAGLPSITWSEAHDAIGESSYAQGASIKRLHEIIAAKAAHS